MELPAVVCLLHRLHTYAKEGGEEGICKECETAIFIFFKDFIYLFIETQRERERQDTGRGRSRLHAESPTWDLIPGLQDHTLGCRRRGAKPLRHRGCPIESCQHRGSSEVISPGNLIPQRDEGTCVRWHPQGQQQRPDSLSCPVGCLLIKVDARTDVLPFQWGPLSSQSPNG